uniref:Uncharacterized protein LOC110199425 n=1 Tax=Phascolarctos cinereus TaxID=38626 RepID=A0A6P5J989_PHACI|nr:uncharacterized protein LOC110199425 [Phascolarctos cinereus]
MGLITHSMSRLGRSHPPNPKAQLPSRKVSKVRQRQAKDDRLKMTAWLPLVPARALFVLAVPLARAQRSAGVTLVAIKGRGPGRGLGRGHRRGGRLTDLAVSAVLLARAQRSPGVTSVAKQRTRTGTRTRTGRSQQNSLGRCLGAVSACASGTTYTLMEMAAAAAPAAVAAVPLWSASTFNAMTVPSGLGGGSQVGSKASHHPLSWPKSPAAPLDPPQDIGLRMTVQGTRFWTSLALHPT